MSRLSGLLVSLLGVACGSAPPPAEPSTKLADPVTAEVPAPDPVTKEVVPRRTDSLGGHGMALFGTSTTTFASHLPMFHPPHDYQVVLRVSLTPAPRLTADELFTFDPKPFELVRAEDPNYEMAVAVYRGHYERGGTRIGEATARIDQVVRFAPLQADAPRPKEPSFVLFGTAREAFLVHVITSRPDFDQIVRVTVPAGLDLTKPIEVRVRRSPTLELKVGESIEAIAAGNPIALRVEAQIYLERGDLEM